MREELRASPLKRLLQRDKKNAGIAARAFRYDTISTVYGVQVAFSETPEKAV